MPRLVDLAPPSCETPGIYWHKGSEQFFCHVGYHLVEATDEYGYMAQKRVQSTQYLGIRGEETKCVEKLNELRIHWDRIVKEQREAYQQEQARRRLLRQPLLERFKPCWPKITSAVSTNPNPLPLTTLAQSNLPQMSFARPKERNVLNITILEAKDRYLAQYKSRIGLQNGKGIKQNSYKKFEQNLNLALALNPGYDRDRKPINIRKRLRDLTIGDYDAFVRFWCDPQNLRSGRTGANYIRALKQMIEGLKIATPEGFDDTFKLKIKKQPNIAPYDPAILKLFLNASHERARLFSLLFLNCGYYQVDVIRLRFDHVTDAEGKPYIGGEMFITKSREKTSHQNDFETTCFVWPETQVLMEKHRARPNRYGTYFLSSHGKPYNEDTISDLIHQIIRANGLIGKFSIKQFRKVGASQIKALADSDAMHLYKANALAQEDKPYIIEDFARLTAALKKFREKLIADGVLVPNVKTE
ncbi:MAG TPA: hypothetical protein VGG19_17040 [Tepidisphaeraceae bacterium]|jgi:integrase